MASAAIVWGGFALFDSFWPWTILRLLFGGAMALFYRTVEFGLNAVADPARRGKIFGVYNLLFGLGLAIGAAAQPELGQTGAPFWGVAAILCAAIPPAALWRVAVSAHVAPASASAWRVVAMVAPLPLLVGFAYGFVEDLPAYLFSIYALRHGLGEAVAAYTLTAAALGGVSIPLLLGFYSDRRGPSKALVAAATAGAICAIVLPFVVASPPAFLGAIFLFCGFAVGLYTLSLALIGARWAGQGLNTANAAFGAAYSSGGLIGPLINGAAIDALNANGIIVSAAIAMTAALAAAIFADASDKARPV